MWWSAFSIVILCLVAFCSAVEETNEASSIMGSPLPFPPTLSAAAAPAATKGSKALRIDTSFKLPRPTPKWPPGKLFATGIIDLGGLQVRQIRSFTKVISISQPNGGATFFEPSPPLPEGFAMLGSYGQTNDRTLFGSVLVGKDSGCGCTLRRPTDYSLVFKTNPPSASFWSPTCPRGYSAVGLVAVSSQDKPLVDKVRCVRSDFTEPSELDETIWAQGGFSLYSLKPRNGGAQARGLCAGTFGSTTQIFCLRNNYVNRSGQSPMPNLSQVKAIFQTYAPMIYVHPKETNLPSSVKWFFSNGALLYQKGPGNNNPTPIDPNGSNLPQGGSDDDDFWIDLSRDDRTNERLRNGNLESFEVYLHAKQMLGGTVTEIAMWVFYPFNGAAILKAGPIDIPLGKIGQHVGDWEHLTLHVSNFDGGLEKVYMSQHSGGWWVRSPDLEFKPGTNKFVAHASLHGHALYPKVGLYLLGKDGFGIRNDAAKGGPTLDTGARFTVIAADVEEPVASPPWLNYMRKWGPTISYAKEIDKVRKLLFWSKKLRNLFDDFIKSLPEEVLGEEGPTGPKAKNSWDGEEGGK